MNRFLKYAALFLLLALVPACTRLPEFARPRMVKTDEQDKTLATGFPYRPFTRDDFRATSLSEERAEHAERIQAYSAILIRVTADSTFRITSGFLYGQRYFFGKIERLAFEAIMLPDRSWWNPKIPAQMKGYVLQHEQIHFALTELTARQLTLHAPKWAPHVLVMELSPREVRAELVRQINERIKTAMEANLKRQAEFDEDTSLFFNPKWQEWWLRKVENELKQTWKRRRPTKQDKFPSAATWIGTSKVS